LMTLHLRHIFLTEAITFILYLRAAQARQAKTFPPLGEG